MLTWDVTRYLQVTGISRFFGVRHVKFERKATTF